MTANFQSPSNVECPRCGYDQRGVIDSWRDACPMSGTCAECGLEFSWSAVLRPELHEPRWCVEYAVRRPFLPPPTRRTMVRCLWPWSFWRSLKMSDPLHPGRLVFYVGLLVLLMGAVYVAEQTTVALAARWQLGQDLQREHATMISNLRRQLKRFQQMPPDLAQPRTEFHRRERDRLDQRIGRLQAMLAAPPPSIRHDPLDAIREAVITPTATTSTGMSGFLAWNQPYPAPCELHDYLLSNLSPRVRTKDIAPRLGLAAVGIGAGISLMVLLPLSFVLLPVSRRLARVRWAHVVRVSLYGLTAPVLIGSGLLLALTAAICMSSSLRSLDLAVTVARYVPVPLIVIWWAVAIRHYLKMPHAWALAIILSIMNILLVLGALWLLLPDVAITVYDLLVEPV